MFFQFDSPLLGDIPIYPFRGTYDFLVIFHLMLHHWGNIPKPQTLNPSFHFIVHVLVHLMLHNLGNLPLQYVWQTAVPGSSRDLGVKQGEYSPPKVDRIWCYTKITMYLTFYLLKGDSRLCVAQHLRLPLSIPRLRRPMLKPQLSEVE